MSTPPYELTDIYNTTCNRTRARKLIQSLYRNNKEPYFGMSNFSIYIFAALGSLSINQMLKLCNRATVATKLVVFTDTQDCFQHLK